MIINIIFNESALINNQLERESSRAHSRLPKSVTLYYKHMCDLGVRENNFKMKNLLLT